MSSERDGAQRVTLNPVKFDEIADLTSSLSGLGTYYKRGAAVATFASDDLTVMPEAFTPEVREAALYCVELIVSLPSLYHNSIEKLLMHESEHVEWRGKHGVQDGNGATAACALELLWCAGFWNTSEEGHGDIISPLHLLASGGCDADCWEDTPVPLAPALLARAARVCALLGANIEQKDGVHRASPLSWAGWFRCEAGARVMLELGADRDASDAYGGTSRQLALHRCGIDLDELREPSEPLLARPAPNPYWAGGRPNCRHGVHGASGTDVCPACKGLLSSVRWQRDSQCGDNLHQLRRLHAGWAEAEARITAARNARYAAMACEVATQGHMLPGPALQAIADVLMADEFVCWRPVTRPAVVEV